MTTSAGRVVLASRGGGGWPGEVCDPPSALQMMSTITTNDGTTSVEVNFWDKGAGKCQVVVEQRKLAGAADVARVKAYWAEALAKLKALLEAPSGAATAVARRIGPAKKRRDV